MLKNKCWQAQAIAADYLTEGFNGPDGDGTLLPRTTPEDPCRVEFTPEVGSIDATAPWLDIPKPLAWEPWKPSGWWTSWFDVVASQRSSGLQPINKSKANTAIFCIRQ